MNKLILVILGTFLTHSMASAAVSVTTNQSQVFKYVEITATKVKAVEVVLKKEVTRHDCNSITLGAEAVRVSGNEVNWWAQFFINTSMMATEAYCPLPNPVQEIVSSEPIRFDSYSNPNIDSEVSITLILPEGFQVEVKEITK